MRPIHAIGEIKRVTLQVHAVVLGKERSQMIIARPSLPAGRVDLRSHLGVDKDRSGVRLPGSPQINAVVWGCARDRRILEHVPISLGGIFTALGGDIPA